MPTEPLIQKRGQVYIAHNAVVTGDVTMGKDTNIWYGCVIRGDIEPITLGERVNIQDLSMVHCDVGVPLVIENDVVAGHRVILHGSTIRSGALIGMGAVLLKECDIGEQAIVGAGSVVPPGMKVPPRMVVMGVPAKVIREVSDEEVEDIRSITQRYLNLAQAHAAGRYEEYQG